MKKNGRDMNTTGTMNSQTMHSGMIWHNVTDNFRLVAEGGYTEKTWYLADDDQEDCIRWSWCILLLVESTNFILKRESTYCTLPFFLLKIKNDYKNKSIFKNLITFHIIVNI